MNIDKIFWINSKNRPDRYRNMIERLAQLNISAERFPAIYGGEIDWNDREHSMFYQQDIKQDLNNGEKGCFLSHREIYKIIKTSDWNKVLILEDDALFMPGFLEDFESLIKQVPEYDMLYLGQWNYDEDVVKGETSALKEEIFKIGIRTVYKAQRCWLTHAYIIDRSVCDTLLNNTLNLYGSVDRVLADIQEKENLRVYAIHPNLINQDITKSSLRNI